MLQAVDGELPAHQIVIMKAIIVFTGTWQYQTLGPLGIVEQALSKKTKISISGL